MSGERVFTVDGSTATPAVPISLAEAGLRERDDLQEWVLAHPEILGPEVKVVTFEFDRWRASSGDRQLDRLDVLGMDPDGRLVVAELKRDKAPDTVEMQAIKYAALASRFTLDTLAEHHARFLSRAGLPCGEDAARDQLLEHAPELDPDVLQRPRIVLVAGGFPPVVTSSVVWLNQMGIDITLQAVQAYRVFDDRTIVTVSQMFPLPDVEDFLVAPQRAQAQDAERNRGRKREMSTVVRLVAEGTIPDGSVLTLRPTSEVTAEVRASVEAWIAEDPRRGRAIWSNDRRAPLTWEFDGESYRPTAIVSQVLEAAAGISRSARGPSWWVLDDGRDLVAVAGIGSSGAFDWAPVHRILAAIPPGHWTTYGDLADVVDTAPLPVGGHIASCPNCENAHRVLGWDGKPAANFAWADPTETRTQRDLLESEGVTFAANGQADASGRLDPAALDALAG